jgi:hypothetical protein
MFRPFNFSVPLFVARASRVKPRSFTMYLLAISPNETSAVSTQVLHAIAYLRQTYPHHNWLKMSNSCSIWLPVLPALPSLLFSMGILSNMQAASPLPSMNAVKAEAYPADPWYTFSCKTCCPAALSQPARSVMHVSLQTTDTKLRNSCST